MDNEPLENMYFNWLCAKVVHMDPSTPSQSYWTLLRTLHSTEFVWTVMGDDNRAEDGVELRSYFLIEARYPDVPEWRQMPCSMLEMLIALSHRAEFQTGERSDIWFWRFMQNIGLDECSDAVGFTPNEIGEVLYRVVWRQYAPNGEGGLFPVPNTNQDQREVQIWYQFCEYLVDIGS